MKQDINNSNNNLKIATKYLYIDKVVNTDSNKQSLDYILLSNKILTQLEELSQQKDYEIVLQLKIVKKDTNGFTKEREKKIPLNISLSELLSLPRRNGSNNTNKRIITKDLKIKDKAMNENTALLFEKEQIEEIQHLIIDMDEFIKAQEIHNDKGKEDVVLETEEISPNLLVSLKKGKNNRFANFGLKNSKNLPKEIQGLFDTMFQQIDLTQKKEYFDFSNIDMNKTLEELNSMNSNIKVEFLLSMMNLYDERPTFEILGDGKDKKLHRTYIYSSKNYIRERLNIDDIEFKQDTNKSNRTTFGLSLEFETRQRDNNNIVFNIREKSGNSDKNLYIGIEQTTQNIKKFLTDHEEIIFVEKGNVINTQEDMQKKLKEFLDLNNQVDRVESLKKIGFEYIGQDIYVQKTEDGTIITKIQVTKTGEVVEIPVSNNIKPPRI